MKPRDWGFIAEDKIDHDGEPFDYIRELHEYLWRVVRAMRPGASGDLRELVDEAVEDLESRRGQQLTYALRAIAEHGDGLARVIAELALKENPCDE